MKTLLILACIIIMQSSLGFAQDTSQTDRNNQAISQTQAGTNFLLTGYGFAGFEKEEKGNSTFGPAGFSPIFLWKISDKLFFESEVEIGIEDGETGFGLEYATLHYAFSRYFTLGVGKFLSPFGTFQERLHPAWINKFAERPLGLSEEGVMLNPMSEFGAEIRGGAPMGESRINYVIYLSNGPKLNTGSDDWMMAGQLDYENFADNNNNKAIGGRFGLLPFPNSSFEIGISGQTAKTGDKKDPLYENVRANLFAVDLNYVKGIDFLKSNIDIKGQFNQVKVDKANYQDTAGMTYTFDNNSKAYYAQIAIRPVQIMALKKLEVAGRYSALRVPEQAMWAGNKTQITAGLNYWLSYRSVLKFNYQITQEKGKDDEGAFFILFAMGF